MKHGISQIDEAAKYLRSLLRRPPYFKPKQKKVKSLEGQKEFDFSTDALTKEPTPAVGSDAKTELPAG